MRIELTESEIRVRRLFAQQVITAGEIESIQIGSSVHHIYFQDDKEVVLKKTLIQGLLLEDELAEFAAKNHISFVRTMDFEEDGKYLETFPDAMRWAEDYIRTFTSEVDPYLKERLGWDCSVKMEIVHRTSMINIFTNIMKDGMKLFPKTNADLTIYVEKFGDFEDYSLDVLDSVILVSYDSKTNVSKWLVIDDVDAMIPMMKQTIENLCREGYVYADSRDLPRN